MEKTRLEYLKKRRAAMTAEEALNRAQDEASSKAIEEEADLQEQEAAREVNTDEYDSEVHQVTENLDNGKGRPVLGCNTTEQRNPNRMDEDVPMLRDGDLETPLLREGENEPVKSQIAKEDKEMEKQIMEEGDSEKKTTGEGGFRDNLEEPEAGKEETSSEEDSSSEDEEPAVKAAPAPAGQKAVETKESFSNVDSSDKDEEPDKDQEKYIEENVMKARLFSLTQEGVYKLRHNVPLGNEDLPEGFLELLSDDPNFDMTDLEWAVCEYKGPLFVIQ